MPEKSKIFNVYFCTLDESYIRQININTTKCLKLDNKYKLFQIK